MSLHLPLCLAICWEQVEADRFSHDHPDFLIFVSAGNDVAGKGAMSPGKCPDICAVQRAGCSTAPQSTA